MPSSDRLLEVRAKIERAKEHVRDLESRVQAFRSTEPYGVRAEDDAQTGDRVYKVEVRSKVPDAFSLIGGDAIHNLRCALDYLARQLVESNSAKPTRATSFPICKSAPENKTQFATKVEGMSPDAVSLIDAFQPYRGGDNTLWHLSELDNIDKHRLLLVVALRQQNPEFTFPLDPAALACDQLELPSFRLRFMGTGDLQDGAEVARLGGMGAAAKDVEFHLSFEIAFGESEIVKGKPVLETLHYLADFVNGVVNQFVPFL